MSVHDKIALNGVLQMFSDLPANHILASHKRELTNQQQEKAELEELVDAEWIAAIARGATILAQANQPGIK